MKLSDGSARGLGALVGVVAFVVAMNVYTLAADPALLPDSVGSVHARRGSSTGSRGRGSPCSNGAQAVVAPGVYYRLESCPHCLTPFAVAGRRIQAEGVHDESSGGEVGAPQSVDAAVPSASQVATRDHAQTPTTERETATFRLPAALLERSPKGWRGARLAYVRSVEEALEVTSLRGCPRRWPRRSSKTSKDQKVSRENYFYSCSMPAPQIPGERAGQGRGKQEEVA